MIPTCQTCSSQLPNSILSKSFLPPCCESPICPSCISKNPRLREYIPCLRCGEVRTEEGSRRVAKCQRDREFKSAEVMFDIDDDDDDDSKDTGDEVDLLDNLEHHGDKTIWNENGNRIDRPPSYTSTSSTSKHSSLRSNYNDNYNSTSSSTPDQGQTSSNNRNSHAPAEDSHEEDTEIVEITHPINKSDTLMSIARKYAADPHDLLTLNSLPPSALHQNPRLLHTRKTLIISRRKVRRQKDLTSEKGINGIQDETVTENEDVESKKRAEERAVKRFQLITKTVDPGIGKAYLSLVDDGIGIGIGSAIGTGSSGSGVLVGNEDGNGIGDGIGNKDGEYEAMKDESLKIDSKSHDKSEKEKVKEKIRNSKMTNEDRALENWFEDDEWERNSGLIGPGKSKSKDGKWVTVNGWKGEVVKG